MNEEILVLGWARSKARPYGDEISTIHLIIINSKYFAKPICGKNIYYGQVEKEIAGYNKCLNCVRCINKYV